MTDYSTALKKLQAHPGKPVYTDFQVVALRDREAEGEKQRLNLKLFDQITKQPICDAIIYPAEWYPGVTGETSYSHYHSVLRFCYAGLASEGKEPELLLQIMKAVWLPNRTNENKETGQCEEGQLIILKFIISPDYNITGAELETAFNCPAKYFYESFLGLQRSIRNAPTSIGFVRGNAIHKGQQYAANAFVRSRDPLEALRAYHRAVIDEWRDSFEVLLRKRYYRGPNKDLRLPLEVDSIVADQVVEKFADVQEDQLLNERLLFSPERGISGRADQIILKKKHNELWEIKTGSRYFIESDYDPLTGVTHPGGVQAFAYQEIVKKVLQEPPKTFIEFFDANAGLDDDNPEIIPLEEHAVIVRRKIDLAKDHSDAYLDFLLQTRNIAFAIESGLLSGYDRYKINEFLSRRYMPALGTDFSLLSSNWNRICNYCPSNENGICMDGKHLIDPDIWLHFPQLLFEYWSWYFRQLRYELNNVKRYLHTLATRELEELTAQGTTIPHLILEKFDNYRYLVTLTSKEKIFTRIREGDAVFVTPAHLKPGEIFSVEGKVESLGTNEIIIKTRSAIKKRDKETKEYRVDKVEIVIFSLWQTRSLTDFLFESMARTGIIGRKLADEELPPTVQLLLGLKRPAPIKALDRKHLLQNLDEYKVEAIEKALGLEPGEIMLIQGPPGTGKTRMIAELAKEIFTEQYLLRSKYIDEAAPHLPKPVLILANTHRAADEVIIKLTAYKELAPYIIRLESYSKDHPDEVKPFIIPEKVDYSEILTEKADPEVLVTLLKKGREMYKQAGIIVGTLGSIGNNMLKGLEFQWVIVDEAGQATEPATLGALRHRCPGSESPNGYPRLVFVGDHKQLPPVVAEETIAITPAIPSSLEQTGLQKTDTLKTSLFERLFRLWKNATENVVILSQQYRMNEAISRIIQRAFYPQVNYSPANEQIGQHTLDEYLEQFTIPKSRDGQRLERTEKIFDSEVPVVFINTTGDEAALEGIEKTPLQTETSFNIREAKIIAHLIADFLQPFYKKDRIIIAGQLGVISPYRHQNNLIYSELRELGIHEKIIDQIRVDTVDRFQGDEREIIILSLTNSNTENSIGQLHREWRRMNVSISRAKAKLVIVGNKETFVEESGDEKELEAKELFRIVFQTIDELKREKKALELTSKKDFIDIRN